MVERGIRDGVELTAKGVKALHRARNISERLRVEFNAAVQALEGAT
jgi:hypothetical protein